MLTLFLTESKSFAQTTPSAATPTTPATEVATTPQFPTAAFPSHTTIVQNGTRFEGFDLGGFKKLLTLDEDLFFAQQRISQLQALNTSCQATHEALQSALIAVSGQLTIVSADRARLYNEWQRENAARHQAENKPRLGTWLGWSLGSGALVVVIVETILLGLGK